MAVLASANADPAEALWAGFSAGDPEARERLLALHYAEFRRVARSVLASDGPKLQIQPTELAHEAAIRLLRLERLDVKDKVHFLALSSRIMRQILLDEVRRFRARKRRTPSVNTYWGEALDAGAPPIFDLEAFDEALDRLMAVDAHLGVIVEHRFYAGLTMEEIASVLDISVSTAKRQWRTARAWLMAQLRPR